jgi:microcompartment protein CcmK/EutM
MKQGAEMYLGRVLGKVVCTHKDAQLEGLKLLIVTAIDKDGNAKGKPFVACDSSGAGNGETVFLCGGGEAALPFAKQRPPSDATILGIVDTIE